jgi:C-terminal processing protease CtpA/Prc
MKEINHNGITPDKTVYFTRKDIFLHQDVQLKAAIKYLNTISK